MNAENGQNIKVYLLEEEVNKRVAEIARIIGGNEKDIAHLESARQLLKDALNYK